MKSLERIFFFTALLLTNVAGAQSGQWTWMHGDNFSNGAGSYGIIGLAAPSNMPPPRYESAQWTDNSGNLWLYGGGMAGFRFSDLWKFDPAINQWTWMHGSSTNNQPPVFGTQGIAAASNTPGGLGFGALTWTDLSGNLWLYGGDDGSSGPYGDLWKYDPAVNMWTWVKGPGTPAPAAVYGTQNVPAIANTPGAREETSCAWTDQNGDLWLFGGTNSGIGASFNDLWKYNIATNMWTWVKGSNLPNQPSVYGTKGVAAPSNTPGGRWAYAHWIDNNNNLWLFGGTEATSPINPGFLNDLWKFDISTGNWTWMSGTNQLNDPGSYGIQCLAASSNIPCGRSETRSCWKDSCGNFWLLGGRDINYDLYNDLWRYDLGTGLWIWVSGDNIPSQPGVFGTLMVPSPLNKPGGRDGSLSWTGNGGFWLFGGQWPGGEGNDLWFYKPDTISVAATAIPSSGCAPLTAGFSAQVAQGCGSLRDVIWTFGDSASGAADTSFLVQPSHTYANPGTYTVTLVARDCGGGADTTQTIITVTAGITATITSTASGCFPTGSASVNASGGSGNYTYNWQPVASTSSQVNNLSPGTYTITVNDGAGCTWTDSVLISLNGSVQVNLGNDTTLCGANSLSMIATGNSGTYSWSTGDTGTTILVSQNGNYSVVLQSGFCMDADTMQVAFVPRPQISGAASFCDQSQVTVVVHAAGGSTFQWSNGETDSSIVVTQPGTYTVIVSSSTCSFSDSVHFDDNTGSPLLWVPNTFTPNTDGKNESFRAYGDGVTDYHLMIFDRWGQFIFESSDINQGWDGKLKGKIVQEDVYVYVIDYRLACGSTNSVQRKIGNVNVIR